MKEKMKYLLISIVSIFIFMLIWFIAVDVLAIFNKALLPSPIKVIGSFFNKFVSTVPDGRTLLQHIATSLSVALSGYVLGILVAVPLGIVMAWYEWVDKLARPVFDFLRTIPGLAWIPVFILLFGIGFLPKIAVIFMSVVFGTVVNTYSGIKQTNEVHVWVAETFGATRHQILWKVAIPTALPFIFTGLRVAFGMAWIALVAAELIASNSGLGFMIQVSRNFGRTDLVIVGMITIGILGAILTIVLEKIEKLVVKGRYKDEKHKTE